MLDVLAAVNQGAVRLMICWQFWSKMNPDPAGRCALMMTRQLPDGTTNGGGGGEGEPTDGGGLGLVHEPRESVWLQP